MTKRWLNLFFRFSGFIFLLKQKIVKPSSWVKVLPFVILLVLLEIIFALISLPMYLLVAPSKLQESGNIFPSKDKDFSQFKNYVIRRKISLVTTLGAGGIFLLKVILIGAVSFYLLGAQQLLAAARDWDLNSAGDYTTSSSSVEFVGGVARLKDLGSTASGTNSNSGFDSNSTGWTYADWLNAGNAAGTYSSTGGNPGGYIKITLNPSQSKTTAGLWRQAFTTTVNNPDSATLNLDWSSITYSVPTAPTTYKLYAFIDTASGNPILGTEVWSSPEIIGTTSWASVANIDISSKISTAGTYYLKIAAYSVTPSTKGRYNTVVGFDNVVVNWSKTTHIFDSSKPTITPTSSLVMNKTVSWNSFAETAVKNGGEVYYQLSSDDGANWQYWNGASWATAGAGNYNIASDINSNIATFTTSSNKIKWKAFLSSDGSQQVSLDNINIGYTENLPPTVQSLSPLQNTSSGYAYINYSLVDQDSDPSSLVTYEYSLTGAFAGEQVTMLASSTDPAHSGVNGLSASPIGAAHTFVWDAKAQLGKIYSTSTYLRMRANDGIANGVYATSSVFSLDYVNPVVSNVSSSEVLNTNDVAITYDLFDNTTSSLAVDLQVSADGGTT